MGIPAEKGQEILCLLVIVQVPSLQRLGLLYEADLVLEVPAARVVILV